MGLRDLKEPVADPIPVAAEAIEFARVRSFREGDHAAFTG